MDIKLSKELIEEAVYETIDSNVHMVDKWLADEPRSWGFLAGKAVIACREKLGRALTDTERREVWNLLWNRLTMLEGSRANDYQANR